MQLINFAIFFVILNAVFLQPVGRAIEKRRAYINSLTTDYDRCVQELQNLATQAEAKRANARRDAELTLSKARAGIADETAQMAAQYGEAAQVSVESAHKTVASELQAARSAEHSSILALADLMLQRAIPREVLG